LVKDIAAGIIGILCVLALAAIALQELRHGQMFAEPASLTAVATGAVFYFFGRSQTEAFASASRDANATTRHAIDSNGATTPNPTEVKATHE
jgi:hypothetical protein